MCCVALRKLATTVLASNGLDAPNFPPTAATGRITALQIGSCGESWAYDRVYVMPERSPPKHPYLSDEHRGTPLIRALVIGCPRSGTTWLTEAMGTTQGAWAVIEPDNHVMNPPARAILEHHGLFPVLRPDEPAPVFEQIWDSAFSPGTIMRVKPTNWLSRSGRAPENTQLARTRWHRGARPSVAVAKTVRAAFCVEWLVGRYRPRVTLIERNPISVTLSWLELEEGRQTADLAPDKRVVEDYVEGLGIHPYEPNASLTRRAAWWVGLLMTSLRRQARHHPEWAVVSHEALSADPLTEIRALCDQVGLRWSRDTEDYLRASNAPGAGFETKRLRHDLPRKWRRHSRHEVRSILDELTCFAELRSWLDEVHADYTHLG